MTAKKLGPYEIERRLATGGMAEVFVARRLGPHGFEKRVALKCILPQLASDPDFVGMFVDEARVAARLQHPNIVQVFDFGEHESALMIAMELVEGSTLQRLLRSLGQRGDTVPPGVALHIAHQASRALAYAHSLCDDEGRPLQIVHRDVTPANLLLTWDGQVKLSDFGIARCSEFDRRTDAGQIRGKVGYMSPEQVLGRELDGRSDVFTLCTVVAEMLLGEPLFDEGTDLEIMLQIRSGDLTVLDRRGTNLPPDLDELLRWGLSRERDRRPTARELTDGIEALAMHRGISRGAEELERLLMRLELTAPTPAHGIARSTAPRPSFLLDSRRPPAPPGPPSEAAPDPAGSRVEIVKEAAYEVRLADGSIAGPVGFADLVRMIVTGQLDAGAYIRKDHGEFRTALNMPELRRYVDSPALSWAPIQGRDPDHGLALASGKLLAEVHRLVVSRATGALHLVDAERKKRIYFVDGRPEFVASTIEGELLGEYLVDRGICLRMEVDMALAELPRFSGRLGDALVGLGVLRPVQLFRALAAQVRERYLQAFRWEKGTYIFVPGARSGAETYPFNPCPYELLRDGAMELRVEHLSGLMDQVRGSVLVPNPLAPLPVLLFRLPEAWERMLARVRGDLSYDRIVKNESPEHGEDAVHRAFFLSLACDLVQAR